MSQKITPTQPITARVPRKAKFFSRSFIGSGEENDETDQSSDRDDDEKGDDDNSAAVKDALHFIKLVHWRDY